MNAPWSDELVKALNKEQDTGRFHPFTCGQCKGHVNLLATREGWICPCCDYKQTWCHGFPPSESGKRHS